MRRLRKNYTNVLLIIFLLIGFSFKNKELSVRPPESLIGIWINTETPEWKWEFKEDGKCYNYMDGQITTIYFYTTHTENSANNKLILDFLKLININDANDVYEYEINGIGEGELYLDFLGDKSSKLIGFIKE
ncbi:hypothetical protein Q4Q34_15200 [Flavivirga abyssicola]|uniref:hypothetical protein n=1 Tax=Flavivirga abyssicola TaxID=3063533 RepID=UPI0026E0CF42|nr:hypothetical protein [Flavivirga sp. MEBiC07777]WVK12562.1 hypothetical protein Q4Q34_15200 [Flavivirga sp. MEBiC07777]